MKSTTWRSRSMRAPTNFASCTASLMDRAMILRCPVAALAGLPRNVVERATDLLAPNNKQAGPGG